MDRNLHFPFLFPSNGVATREGGVDRNNSSMEARAAEKQVATREGGVDRNLDKPL